MKKTIGLFAAVIISTSAIANDNSDNSVTSKSNYSYTDFFMGGNFGVGFLTHKNTESTGVPFSIGANVGVKMGERDSRYNYGFTTSFEIGASPFRDLDDNRARFKGLTVMFDNYIRMQKSWRRALILSAGYGAQEINSFSYEGGIAASVGLMERIDKHTSGIFRINFFSPTSGPSAFNAGISYGIRYVF